MTLQKIALACLAFTLAAGCETSGATASAHEESSGITDDQEEVLSSDIALASVLYNACVSLELEDAEMGWREVADYATCTAYISGYVTGLEDAFIVASVRTDTEQDIDECIPEDLTIMEAALAFMDHIDANPEAGQGVSGTEIYLALRNKYCSEGEGFFEGDEAE